MTSPAPLHRIALPVDLDRGSEVVYAHGLAVALHNGASQPTGLHVVHAHPAGEAADYRRRLPSLRETLVRWGRLPTAARDGDIAGLGLQVVLEDVPISEDVKAAHAAAVEVASLAPDLLVLGTHRRRGLSQLIHPSISERIARINRVPALFLGHRDPGWIDTATGKGHVRRVVCPVGGDLPPDVAVTLAARWLPVLSRGPFDLTLVHVGAQPDGPPPPLPSGFDGTVRSVAHNVGDLIAGVQAEVELEKADLILMASHGHDSWLDDLAGSKTERLVRWTTTPVLAIPLPPGS